MYNTHNWCVATDICKNICRMILTDVWTGNRTLAVVDSVYTTVVAGSKNKRFNPARYVGELRDAKRGGVDSHAQAAAAIRKPKHRKVKKKKTWITKIASEVADVIDDIFD